MVFFNYSTMQMVVKVVYYGPGLCGKTTNLEYIYSKTAPNSRGEMVSLETETDRTLFFDLLPIDVGVIGGFKTKFQLYTVPGQVFYNSTRKLVLKGVDGIIFVADSQTPMLDANIESFENLKINLKELGLTIDDVPIVFQYNKRDLTNIMSVDEMNSALNPMSYPFVEASAITGQGVFETLKLASKHTLLTVKKTMKGKKPDKKPITPPKAEAVKPPVVIPPSPEPKQEKEVSKDFFADKDLVLNEEMEQEIADNKEEIAAKKASEEKQKQVSKEEQKQNSKSEKQEIPVKKPKKTAGSGLNSIDDLLNDLMPTKQTFTKQVKFQIDKNVFKQIKSATVTVEFKDEDGNVVDTQTFSSGINKKKGIKKVLLKYLIDLIQWHLHCFYLFYCQEHFPTVL